MDDRLASLAFEPTLRAHLAEAWHLPMFDVYNSIDSTQDAVRALADDGAAAWTLVVADHQSSGRGQHGRSWHAEPGGSLMFSLLIRPETVVAAPLLPLRAGLAVARAVDKLLEHSTVMLKWPNDLILQNGKVGGVLCEAQTRGKDLAVVVGVGLNVGRFPVPQDGPPRIPPPAYLAGRLMAGTDRLALLEAIVSTMRDHLERGNALLMPDELAEYERRDWLRGRAITSPAIGLCRGIDPQGQLIVERSNGTIERVIAGRVELAA